MANIDSAPHMNFPEIWALKDGVNPEVLAAYLRWLTEDDARLASAIDFMQWQPVGFNSLLVARQVDEEAGTTAEALQLNFYQADQKGTEDPHGHSRPSITSWYARPDARQVITRHLPLPEGTARIPDLLIEERLVAANCIIDYRDGRRPGYHPIIVGSRLILKQSLTRVAPLGSQWFSSLEVHHVGFEGLGVAISIHHKGPEETAELSELNGLMNYKGLTAEQAEEVKEARDRLGVEIEGSPSEPRLGPVTMIYPPLDFDAAGMETVPTSTEAGQAEALILGGLSTAKYLVERK